MVSLSCGWAGGQCLLCPRTWPCSPGGSWALHPWAGTAGPQWSLCQLSPASSTLPPMARAARKGQVAQWTPFLIHTKSPSCSPWGGLSWGPLEGHQAATGPWSTLWGSNTADSAAHSQALQLRLESRVSPSWYNDLLHFGAMENPDPLIKTCLSDLQWPTALSHPAWQPCHPTPRWQQRRARAGLWDSVALVLLLPHGRGPHNGTPAVGPRDGA